MIRLTAAFAAAYLLLACNAVGDPVPRDTPVPSDTPEPNGEVVTVENIAFNPASLTIDAGTEVTWENNDAVGHTVTHGDQGVPVDDPLFDESLGIGDSFSFTFDEPGTYAVTCTIHPQQNMTVTVE